MKALLCVFATACRFPSFSSHDDDLPRPDARALLDARIGPDAHVPPHDASALNDASSLHDAPPPPDAASPADAPVHRSRFFITAAAYNADFAILANGDALAAGDLLCQSAADSVLAGGTWKVWLSTSTVNAIDRIVEHGPWYRMSGSAVLFNNKPNLRTLPDVPIEENEHGHTVLWGDDDAWTGTSTGGGAGPARCGDWTSVSASVQGTYGSARASSAVWTSWSTMPCNDHLHLYCIEQ
jgi:hypothetical protein